MDKIRTRLIAHVESISNNIKRIQEYESEVPQIEIDILLETIRTLYSDTLSFSAANKTTTTAENATTDDIRTENIRKEDEVFVTITEKVEDFINADRDAEIERQTVLASAAILLESERIANAQLEEERAKKLEDTTPVEEQENTTPQIVEEPQAEETTPTETKQEEDPQTEEAPKAEDDVPTTHKHSKPTPKIDFPFNDGLESDSVLEDIVNDELIPKKSFMTFVPMEEEDSAPINEEVENTPTMVTDNNAQKEPETINEIPTTLLTYDSIDGEKLKTTIAEQLIQEEEPEQSEKTVLAEKISQPKTILDKLNEQKNLKKEEKTAENTPKAENTQTKETAPTTDNNSKQQANTPEKTTAQTQKKTEESHQVSLFDYLKSSNVSKAAEQVDKFSGVKTIADKFLETKEKSSYISNIDTESKKQKVQDLRSVIGVNDKFLFISELFKDNMRAYNDFILKLSKIDSREDALEYIKTIEETYNWDSESQAVQTFFKIFERKF